MVPPKCRMYFVLQSIEAFSETETVLFLILCGNQMTTLLFSPLAVLLFCSVLFSLYFDKETTLCLKDHVS